jgi:hypothetical protein
MTAAFGFTWTGFGSTGAGWAAGWICGAPVTELTILDSLYDFDNPYLTPVISIGIKAQVFRASENIAAISSCRTSLFINGTGTSFHILLNSSP